MRETLTQFFPPSRGFNIYQWNRAKLWVCVCVSCRFPRPWRPAVLPAVLLDSVRFALSGLQPAHSGKLHLSPQLSVAPAVLRVSGESASVALRWPTLFLKKCSSYTFIRTGNPTWVGEFKGTFSVYPARLYKEAEWALNISQPVLCSPIGACIQIKPGFVYTGRNDKLCVVSKNSKNSNSTWNL